MTTDIKSRLSGVGKQWKEKLTAKMTAEEAKGASPADNAAVEEQEPLAAATETAAEDALNALAQPVSEKPGETDSETEKVESEQTQTETETEIDPENDLIALLKGCTS